MRQQISKLLILMILPLIAAVAGGCAHNDGDIGYLFGTWRVDSYTCDGVSVTNPGFSTFFSFQSTVVCATIVSDKYGDHSRDYGTFTDNGDDIILDFTHSDSATPQGAPGYTPPAWLGMTSAYPMVMHIVSRQGDDMQWQWVDANGVTHLYNLHKSW